MSTSPSPATPLAGFVAGATSVLTVHQGLLLVLNTAGAAPWPAYSTAPTRPWGLPEVVSAAFWGGVWGAALAIPMLRAPQHGRAFWRRAVVLGAVVPTTVGAALLAIGAGQRFSNVSPAVALLSALAVNGAWGAATAAGARALLRSRRR